MLHECLLKRMQFSIECQSLDGEDILVLNILDWIVTGSDRFLIDYYRARSTLSSATAVFCAG
jgi:hypothetical protein